MKVCLINGSPNEHGCTARALFEVAKQFNKHGIDTEILWVGKQVLGCVNCRWCKDNKENKCKLSSTDSVAQFLEKLDRYDGLVFGSPVYYAGITGQLTNFLTRCFYSSASRFKYKPVAGITVSRRAGNELAFNHLNMYFSMHNMIIVGNQYWNEVHGDFPNELEYDKEGMQSMRKLADNMTYVLEGLQKVAHPTSTEKHIHTNFISREFLATQKETN